MRVVLQRCGAARCGAAALAAATAVALAVDQWCVGVGGVALLWVVRGEDGRSWPEEEVELLPA